MMRYSMCMKSDAASPALRKLTEMAAHGLRPNYPPQERFYDDFALLAFPVDNWVVGLRVDFTSDSWAVAEVLCLPSEMATGLPPVVSDEVVSYLDVAIIRARERRRAAAEQLTKLKGNADFVQERFEAWRDKSSEKTNVEYAALAAKYAEQIRLGNSKATATLAEMVNVSPAVMAQRIKEARRRFLLTPGERGKASGTLTPLGVLLTDPDFPGFHPFRAAGMTQRELADKFGISEWYVWQGLTEGGIPDEPVKVPEATRPVSVDDILREAYLRKGHGTSQA